MTDTVENFLRTKHPHNRKCTFLSHITSCSTGRRWSCMQPSGVRPWILELGSSRFVYFQLITCLFSFGKIAYNIIAYIYTNKISDIISLSPCCLQLRGCKTALEEIACLDLPFSFQANKVDFAGRFYIP